MSENDLSNKKNETTTKPEFDIKECFSEGQKIKVGLAETAHDKFYESFLRSFTNERLYVDIPLEKNAFIVPSMGTTIFTSVVINNCVYTFTSPLINITRLEGRPVWILDMPINVSKLQRRSFLRMDVLLPIEVKVEARDGIFTNAIKTNCLDISAGGIRYVLDFPLPKEKTVKLLASDFPGIGSLDVLCRTIRTVPSLFNEENYWVGAQFMELPYKTEDKIAKYIFDVQKKIVINSSSE